MVYSEERAERRARRLGMAGLVAGLALGGAGSLACGTAAYLVAFALPQRELVGACPHCARTLTVCLGRGVRLAGLELRCPYCRAGFVPGFQALPGTALKVGLGLLGWGVVFAQAAGYGLPALFSAVLACNTVVALGHLAQGGPTRSS